MRKVDNKMIEIKEEVTIGNVILEKGDRIEIINEDIQTIQRELGSLLQKYGIADLIFGLYSTVSDYWSNLSLEGKQTYGENLGKMIDLLASLGTVGSKIGKIDKSFFSKV